jgi:anti-sigma factor (TIGR02949 family)
MTRDAMLSCSDAVRQLWEYLDGGLPPEDAARIDDHLLFCRQCCGELGFARELQSLLLDAADDDVPSDVRARLERFLGDLEEEG